MLLTFGNNNLYFNVVSFQSNFRENYFQESDVSGQRLLSPWQAVGYREVDPEERLQPAQSQKHVYVWGSASGLFTEPECPALNHAVI